MAISSIFRYPGGKARRSVREWIMTHAPRQYTEYREPFVGGGGVFFSVDNTKRRWINDLNEGLMSVYQALKDRPTEFIELCRKIKPPEKDEAVVAARPGSTHAKAKNKALYNARLKRKFDFFALNEECDQALRYLFVNRTVWAGRVVYEQKSRMYFSNPHGWNMTATDSMEKAASCLSGVKITVGDYSKLLSAPGEDVWIYCDPPYVVNTELCLTCRQYRDNFEHDDHKKFADAVKASAHKIAISYDDNPVVRELFPEGQFWYDDTTWAYRGTASDESQLLDGQSKRAKKRGRELVITNYDWRK